MTTDTRYQGEPTASEKLRDAMQANSITIDAEFIPWSQSKNAKPKPTLSDRSLNWRVVLKHNGREIYATHYSAGIGHCPSYTQRDGAQPSLHFAEKIARETEEGRAANIGRKPIQVDVPSVFAALLSDGDAIDYARYEDWASEFGYDVDSRKGEATYRECLACGLALRAAFGEQLLITLKELAREL